MKSVTLRALLREPRKVKRITRAGQSVQVTDHGHPLWLLQPAGGTEANELDRRRAIDEILDEALRAKPATLSLAKIIVESRR